MSTAPLPAPLPGSLSVTNVAELRSLPRLALLDENKEKEKYYIQFKYRSHGKQFIGNHLQQQHQLEEIPHHRLPNKKVIFYWLQREYQYQDASVFHMETLAEVMPCIAYIPSQGLLCEKAKMANALYQYHGDYTWTFVPQTHHITYDFNSKSWDVSNLKDVFKHKSDKDVWIAKSSLGALGKEVHLFVGNDIEALHTLLKTKYVPENWRDIVQQFSKELMVETIILQEYITKPLLFKGHYKFDLRMYVLTASTNPTVVFYHQGKMRICGVKYNDDYSENSKWGHITNCKIQREHENFEYTSQSIDGQEMLSDWEGFVRFIYDLCVKEDHFDIEWYEDIKEKKKQGLLTYEDVDELIATKAKRIIRDLCDSVGALNDQESIELQRPCQFTFHGIDVMMDDAGKMWLLEVNRCASISLVGFDNIRDMTKRMLAEMTDICLEIRSIKRSGRRFDQNMPLSSQKVWQRVPLTYLEKKKEACDEKKMECDLSTQEIKQKNEKLKCDQDTLQYAEEHTNESISSATNGTKNSTYLEKIESNFAQLKSDFAKVQEDFNKLQNLDKTRK